MDHDQLGVLDRAPAPARLRPVGDGADDGVEAGIACLLETADRRAVRVARVPKREPGRLRVLVHDEPELEEDPQ